MAASYLEYVHVRPNWDELQLQLGEANHFTAQDLESNRRGRMGPHQFAFYLKTLLLPPFFVLLAGILISFVVRVAFAAYVEHEPILAYMGKVVGHLFALKFERFREVYLLTAGERLPIIVGAFVVTAPVLCYRKLRDIPFRVVLGVIWGVVRMEEGPVITSTDEKKAPGRAGRKGETIDLYYYHINGRRLNVRKAAHDALACGVRYRVYYLPWSNELLSIEPVELR